jgi:hypothetical protein
MRSHVIASLLLLAGTVLAQAAPGIPSSELPGRERDRFRVSPLDRFTQPDQPTTKPVWRWDCKSNKRKGAKQRRRTGQRC